MGGFDENKPISARIPQKFWSKSKDGAKQRA